MSDISFDTFKTEELQNCLNVIRAQAIEGYTHVFGDKIEKELERRRVY